MTANNDALPPLPEAKYQTGLGRAVFGADQMRDYARAAIRALSADRGEAVDGDWPEHFRNGRFNGSTSYDEWRIGEERTKLQAANIALAAELATAQENLRMSHLALESAQSRLYATPPSPAESAEQWDRENLGIIVRDEWMAWAREQPNIKTSWLTPWTLLTEPEREVDRRIGERIARCVAVTLKRQAATAAPSGVSDARKEAMLNIPYLIERLDMAMVQCRGFIEDYYRVHEDEQSTLAHRSLIDQLEWVQRDIVTALHVNARPFCKCNEAAQPQPGRVEGMDDDEEPCSFCLQRGCNGECGGDQ